MEKKTNNGMLGISSSGSPLTSILELAKANGLSTGVVATSSVTHATPASFAVHQLSRSANEAIANDFVYSNIDLFIGGGRKYFEKRDDNRNLSSELCDRGYHIAYTMDEAKHAKQGKLAVLLAEEHLSPISERDTNYLLHASQIAISLLKNNRKGFVLMIEGSQIDMGGHANDQAYMIEETLDFDRAVGEVLDFAEQDGKTLVLITADRETGGVSIKNGDYYHKEVEVVFTTGGHTASPVPFFAYGPGCEHFSGWKDNTSTFAILKSLLKLKID